MRDRERLAAKGWMGMGIGKNKMAEIWETVRKIAAMHPYGDYVFFFLLAGSLFAS